MNQILNTISSKGFIIVHLLFCCLHRQHSLHTSTPPSHLMYTQSKTKIQRQKDVQHWEILPVPKLCENFLCNKLSHSTDSNYGRRIDKWHNHTARYNSSWQFYAVCLYHTKYVYTAIAVLENVLLDYVDYSQLCGILSTSFSLYYATWQRTSDQWNISQF